MPNTLHQPLSRLHRLVLPLITDCATSATHIKVLAHIHYIIMWSNCKTSMAFATHTSKWEHDSKHSPWQHHVICHSESQSEVEPWHNLNPRQYHTTRHALWVTLPVIFGLYIITYNYVQIQRTTINGRTVKGCSWWHTKRPWVGPQQEVGPRTLLSEPLALVRGMLLTTTSSPKYSLTRW